MVPQLVSLYGDLTVRENIDLCADFYGLPKDLKDQSCRRTYGTC